MSNEIFENLSKLSETAAENVRKLGEVNFKQGEKLLKEQAALTESLFEVNKEAAEKATKTKDYQEFAAEQAEYFQEVGQLFLKGYQKWTEAATEAGKVYGKLVEETANTDWAAGTKKAGGSKAKSA